MPKTDLLPLRIKSGGRTISRHPVVIIGLGLVVTIGLVLVFGLVIRPWANPNGSLYYALNLGKYLPMATERTAPAMVGNHGSMGMEGHSSSHLSGTDGSIAYVAYGCAFCHGLGGMGAVVAGPLSGLDSDLIQSIVRLGPGGMPAYSEAELSTEELKAIADWLSAQGKATPTQGGPPLIPHTVEGRADCLMCHEEGIGGAPQIPTGHEGRTNNMCEACHEKK